MTQFLDELVRNPFLGPVGVAWLLAQGLKVATGIVRERRLNFRWFVGTGGMPSCHAAGVAALATAIGLGYGFHSSYFAIVSVMALITMFDAQGFRRASGLQAEALNRIMDDIYAHRGIQQDRLKELLGHTPVEVLAGALLGILTAVVLVGRAGGAGGR